MTKEEMNKYAFTCMVKDNPDEAVKNLILYSEEIEDYQKALDETMSEKIDLENIVNKAIEYIKDNPKLVNDKLYQNDKDTSFIFINNKIKLDLLDILRGEDND